MADVLVDVGPLLAVVNRNDQHHQICSQILLSLEPPIFTTLPVLTEALYLCYKRVGWVAQERLLQVITEGAIQAIHITPEDFVLVREQMLRYNDLPMDFADASLVVVAQRLRFKRIFTIDRKDFSVYRLGKNQAFEILGP